MKKLTDLYKQYFDLTTENFNIQEERKCWPAHNIADYEGMVARVNQLSPLIRKTRAEIERLEGLI
jgi:hypothetical protein